MLDPDKPPRTVRGKTRTAKKKRARRAPAKVHAELLAFREELLDKVDRTVEALRGSISRVGDRLADEVHARVASDGRITTLEMRVHALEVAKYVASARPTERASPDRWHVPRFDAGNPPSVVDREGVQVARVWRDPRDANLIAAAPEMRDALKQIADRALWTREDPLQALNELAEFASAAYQVAFKLKTPKRGD